MRPPWLRASRGGSLAVCLLLGSPLGFGLAPHLRRPNGCASSARLGGFAAASAALVPAPAVASALKRKARKTGILYNYHFFRLAGRVRLPLPANLKSVLITCRKVRAPCLPACGSAFALVPRATPCGAFAGVSVQNDYLARFSLRLCAAVIFGSFLFSLCRVGARRFRLLLFENSRKRLTFPSIYATICLPQQIDALFSVNPSVTQKTRFVKRVFLLHREKRARGKSG